MTLPDEALGRDDAAATEEALTAPGRPEPTADLEAPEADAVEQAIPADASGTRSEISRSLEVNEYDAVEQARVVELDDDY